MTILEFPTDQPGPDHLTELEEAISNASCLADALNSYLNEAIVGCNPGPVMVTLAKANTLIFLVSQLMEQCHAASDAFYAQHAAKPPA